MWHGIRGTKMLSTSKILNPSIAGIFLVATILLMQKSQAQSFGGPGLFLKQHSVCSTNTVSNCSLPKTATGGSNGSCSSGYYGSCSYSCLSPTWTVVTNTCSPPTTWNPSDCYGPGTANIFSNGNLTNDRSGGGNWITTRTTMSRSTGKRHFEITANSNPGSNLIFGLMNGSTNVVSTLTYPGQDATAVSYRTNGTTYNAGGLSLPPMSNGGVVAVEVDFSAMKMWFGQMVSSIWDIAHSYGGGTATVLANQNLQVSRTGGGNWVTTRATTSKSVGKQHFEMTINAVPGNNLVLGVVNMAADVTGSLIYPGQTTSQGIGYNTNGTTYGAGGLSLNSLYNNDVVAVEIDFSAKKLWFGKTLLSIWDMAHTYGAGAVTMISNQGFQITRSGGGNWVTTRSTMSYSSGKKHFELTMNAAPANNLILGLVNSSADVNGSLIYPGQTSSQGVGYGSNGNTYGAGGITMPSLSNGDVVAVEVDFSAKKLWWQSSSNGKWNNDVTANQNPATGTGGIDISGISGALYAAIGVYDSSTIATANFGASAFSITPSSGFSGWDSSGPYWNSDILANQNPATGTGGIDISGISGSLFPASAVATSGIPVTINFGVSAFSVTPSSGFSAWDGTSGAKVYWNGQDVGAQNPATGAGGVSISGISGPFYGAIGIYSGSPSTANFGASAFSITPSSGFSGWDPP